MELNAIELNVLVKNRTVTEYVHHNQTYIEGRAGSNYEIEIRNKTAQQVEAVISVDGLSIIDGAEAGSDSRGYLIAPMGLIRIPGWLIDPTSVAKFAFAGKDGSYASQINESVRNIGVIGTMVFAPIAPPVFNYNLQSSPMASGISTGASVWNLQPMTNSSVNPPFIGASTIGASTNSSEQKTSGGNIAQALGTAFGHSAAFATQTVAFRRGAMLALISMFYDNLKGLRARGVPIVRQPREHASRLPQAFPMLGGCKIPPSWRG
jgi:hypothetical protein